MMRAMERSAVLLSGGVDSVVLLALELGAGRDAWPVHVRAGLAWEQGEADAIARILAAPLFHRRARPVTSLHIDMRDVYSHAHWAVSGQARAWDEPDETVFIAGRNITLIAKAAVFCASQGIHRLVLGPLAGNPFPDATPEFFDAMGRAMSIGLAQPFQVIAPLAAMQKHEVISMGGSLGVPFEHTMSCNDPVEGRHCGRCNKCRERREGFRDAGVDDPAAYEHLPA